MKLEYYTCIKLPLLQTLLADNKKKKAITGATQTRITVHTGECSLRLILQKNCACEVTPTRRSLQECKYSTRLHEE
jgi:hypothetical protein